MRLSLFSWRNLDRSLLRLNFLLSHRILALLNLLIIKWWLKLNWCFYLAASVRISRWFLWCCFLSKAQCYFSSLFLERKTKFRLFIQLFMNDFRLKIEIIFLLKLLAMMSSRWTFYLINGLLEVFRFITYEEIEDHRSKWTNYKNTPIFCSLRFWGEWNHLNKFKLIIGE